MNQGRTVFSQLISFLPDREFRRCVERYQGDLRLRELAEERRRFGYRRLQVLLVREGWVVNHKRVYRLYVEGKLGLRRKPRRRRAPAAARLVLAPPTEPDQVWTMDFTQDTFASRPSNCAACSGSASRARLFPTPVDAVRAVGHLPLRRPARPSLLHSPSAGGRKTVSLQ